MPYLLFRMYLGDIYWQLHIHWKKFDNGVLIMYSPLPAILFDFHSIIFLISTISHTRALSDISMFFLSNKKNYFSYKSSSIGKIASSLKDYIYMKQSGAYLFNVTVKNDSDVNLRSENDLPISCSSIRIKYFHEFQHQYVTIIDSNVDQVCYVISNFHRTICLCTYSSFSCLLHFHPNYWLSIV